MNKYCKDFIAFVLVSGLWVGLNSLGPASPPPASADDALSEEILEEILEGVLEEVREEIKQDIKTDVRRETTEVVAEEKVSPSNSFTGVYVGLIDDELVTGSLTITPSSVVGRCTGAEGSVVTVSGSSGDGIFYSFDFQLSAPCIDTGDGSAEVLSGTGEPGTIILVKLDDTACTPQENDAILVKQ